MIQTFFYTLLICCISLTTYAQTNVELNIQHKFDNSNFVLEQPYMGDNNRAILIRRMKYYISNVELIHDQGQSTALTGQSFLIDGEISSYNLGTVNTTIDEFERINFDLGVDVNNNQTLPSSYNAGHSLAQTDMYSSSNQSYIFIVIEGLIDSDGNQLPDKPFKLRATGDQLLRNVSVKATVSSDNNNLKIDLVANIANWLKDIDLEQAGTQENDGVITEHLCDNTNNLNVFSNVATTNVTQLVSPQNHIHIDSRLSYAPTIHYKFYTTEYIDMTITNMNGSYFIQRYDLQPDGDFYMSDDLAAGVYVVIFTSPNGIRQSKRFVIRN